MKVFNENVKTKTHKGDRNMLVVETKHEIFFGVFNVKLNGKFYVAEQVAEFDGTPILKLPVEINGVIEERLFDVVVGSDTGIVFNPDITSEQMLESATNVNENPLDIDEVFKPKVIEEDISMSEEDVSELIYGNTKEQPSNFDTESPLKYGNTTRDIDQIVLNLEKSIGSLQEKAQSTIKDYTNRQLKKLKQLSENGIQNSPQFIETAKTELVSEFVKITENIKSELSQSNINSRKDISNTLEYKLANAVNEFDKKIKTQFENYSQIYNDTISQYIDTIFETTVKPATSGLMLQVSEDLNSQVEEFKTEVFESLSDKISNNELREFEEIFSDNSQRLISANIDLNNKIDQISKKIITEAIIDNKIADNIKKIEEHFDTNITAVSEKADTLDEATREYLLSVIAESRQTLLNEISAIKDNVAVEYIVENKKKTEKLDILTLKSELQKDLDLKVSNAIVNLKKFTAYYGGGGGTVAVQFADGGTMNGDLTVVGAISASQYLGITIPSGDYLPLSGGTVTGNVTVTGSVSADRIYTTQLDALSANITVIDIKQYELSGFNVTGDVTINGSVSAQNISAANLYSSNAVTIGGNLTVDTDTLFVDSVNDRVGVGTTLPTEKLTVSGNISASGNVTASNLTYSIGDQTIAGVKTFSNNIVGNGTANRLPNQLAVASSDIITKGLADSRYTSRNERITDDTTFLQTTWEQFLDFDDQYNQDLNIVAASGATTFGASPVFGDTWSTGSAGVTAFNSNDAYAHRGIFLVRGPTANSQAYYIGINRTTIPYILTNRVDEFTSRVFINGANFATQGYFKIGPIPKGGTGGSDTTLQGGLIFNPYLHPTNLVLGVHKSGVVTPFTFTTNPLSADFLNTGVDFTNLLNKWVNITYKIDRAVGPTITIIITRDNVVLFQASYNVATHPVVSTWTNRNSLHTTGASNEIGLQSGHFVYTAPNRSQLFIDYLYYKVTGTSAAPSNWNSLRF